ncbi:MAG: TlpA family protein disulfide reductase [Rubrivivax sp.]|nr:TlpA family protein disulfide reductase [Rubrivivax sp.]
MKRRDLLAAAAAWPLVPAPAHAAAAAPGGIVDWPEVTLLDSSRFGPAQARGQAMVVVFWSTSCPYCRRHNQHVEKLHRAATGRALTVLGVARDRDPEAVRRHMQLQGHSFPVTQDYRALASVLSTRNMIPLTVTVDRQGRLRQVIPGEMFESDVLELLQLAG